MNYTIEHTELSRLLTEASKMGAKRALEEAGLANATTTLADIRHVYGRTVSERARVSPSIKWFASGSGPNSSLYCRKADFEKFLFDNGTLLNKKKKQCHICGETNRQKIIKTPDGTICLTCGDFTTIQHTKNAIIRKHHGA